MFLKEVKYLFIILLSTISLQLSATHNRAGEITYQYVSGLKYKVTVTTYTDPTSPADRPELEIDWGHGNKIDTIYRILIVPILPNVIQKNVYEKEHIFPGPGPFKISVSDPNRVASVVNMPGSVDIPFFIQSELVISPFIGTPNNSPILNNPPIDNGCVFVKFQHNPGAVDPDKDSLVYSLVDCRGFKGAVIPTFSYPAGFSIDQDGTVTWNVPVQQGFFNIAILIQEYRNGKFIGSVLRDMQIIIGNCSNFPPVISTQNNELCVEAGTFLQFNVTATDPEGDNVILTALTGSPGDENNGNNPFMQPNSPAVFNTPGIPSPSVTGQFLWQTECSHVSKQQYKATFKAEDIGSPNTLSSYYTVKILVVGPKPKNLSVNPLATNMLLKWNKSECNNVVKYKIYRREGPSGWNPAFCETGVPSYTGFQLIATTNTINDTNFTDTNNGKGLIHGKEYCYRVVAIFPDGAESYASDEVCNSLIKDVAIITHVSVDSTSTSDGRIYLDWSKPTEHNTIQYPGPYKYLIYRAANNNGTGFTLIDSTMSINDTIYTLDTLLNTIGTPYSYRVDFYSGNDLVGKSNFASSIYAGTAPGDDKLYITWTENTPWTNTSYVIYRRNQNMTWDSIGTTNVRNFIDKNLINGTTYCYRIKSIGGYSSAGITYPLINYSQIACGVPYDNEPPCPPTLTVVSACEKFENILTWTNPNNSCADDVEKYHIYFLPAREKDFKLVATVSPANDTLFYHSALTSAAGCYAVTAVDSVGNESAFSDSSCVDNCPTYELPNVFTPGNNDGKNDLYVPFPYRYIESINLKIYNRWGKLVFETQNPEINWDGIDKDSGQPCSSGVYFYVCQVYEERFDGISSRTLKGNIQIFRAK